ncbi:MAG: DHH family phosphoesterase [archaeon]|nr:MAG: DHH family phosphoesterase [archaeon]
MRAGASGQFPYVDPKTIRRAAVLCHRNADADAYLSAFALSALLRSISPGCDVDIVTPEGMTTLTTKLSRKFEHRVVEEGGEDYDLYVAVDVGDTELLKGWLEKMKASKGLKVLVDHHPLRDREAYDHVVVDESATSAAEVVYSIFEELGVKVDRLTAQALLEAVMFDSSHLAIAGPGALRTVVKLIDAGADIGDARRELRSEPDYGEVLAKLKGAKRLRIYKLGPWVAATSLVGSFQAHVARGLVYLGADVAIVGGEAEGETRVSMRSTQRFLDRAGVQLGTQVAEAATKKIGGHGGGHATAASFATSVGEEEAVAAALGAVSGLLSEEAREIE